MQYMVVYGRKSERSLTPYTVINVTEYQLGDKPVTIKGDLKDAELMAHMMNDAFQHGVMIGNSVNIREMEIK